MKSFTAIITALAIGLATVEGLSIPKRECSAGGVTQTVDFDSIESMSGLTVSGYTITDSSDTTTAVQNLEAVSSPNLAYTGAASGWPPAVPAAGFTSNNGKTFTVKSFYLGVAPGTGVNLIVLGGVPGATAMSKEIVVSSSTSAAGALGFVDLTTESGWSGLSSFAVKAQSSGFDKAHAIDSLVIQWDC